MKRYFKYDLMATVVLALAIGALVGKYKVFFDHNQIMYQEEAAQLLQYDKVLSLLESKQFDEAMQLQKQFLRQALMDAKQPSVFAEQNQGILERRRSLLETP
jgi:hypothetical protein